MKREPEISIIVPVYKSEAFLRPCIESLINQTFRNVEIILVDDGSPDQSGEICDEYANQDDRVVVIHQENQGGAAAVNRGIEEASAPFFTYLDGDDWLELNTCELAYEAINKHKVDVVFWSYFRDSVDGSKKDIPIFKEDSLFEGDKMKDLRRRLIGMIGEELRNPIRTDAIAAGWGRLYRRSVIIENDIKWVDTQLVGSSDVLFSVQVFQQVKNAFFLNKHLNHYRLYNPNSLTKNYQYSLHKKLINLFKILGTHIEKYDLDEKSKMALNNRICLSLINNTLSLTSLRNQAPSSERIVYFEKILNDPIYSAALREFKLDYLPIHWKLFFLFAKWKFSWGLYSLGRIMQRLR